MNFSFHASFFRSSFTPSSDSSYGGKQVGQRSNKVKVTTKETEVRSGFSRSCDAPQFLINSDMLSIKSQLLKVEESWEEPVLRKPYVKKIPWKEQIENEYEWQSLQFKRKAKKVGRRILTFMLLMANFANTK